MYLLTLQIIVRSTCPPLHIPTIVDKSLGTLFYFWGIFQFTQVQPLPSPHKQCWTHVSRIFSEFQLCIGWGRENCKKILKRMHCFMFYMNIVLIVVMCDKKFAPGLVEDKLNLVQWKWRCDVASYWTFTKATAKHSLSSCTFTASNNFMQLSLVRAFTGLGITAGQQTMSGQK